MVPSDRFPVRTSASSITSVIIAQHTRLAASSGLTGGLLTLVGYSAVTAFDPKVIDGIYNITCLVPAAGFLLLALALKFLYPLDRKKVEENTRILKEKRGE